jgi:hypothetical protein
MVINVLRPRPSFSPWVTTELYVSAITFAKLGITSRRERRALD